MRFCRDGNADMKKGKMKIALAPIQGTSEKHGQLRDMIAECCWTAVSQNADLICFPELILNGTDTEELGMLIYDRAEPVAGSSHRWLTGLAKNMGLYIAAGMIQKSQVPGRLYSSYLICCPDGQTKNTYQKRYFDDLDQLYMTGSASKQVVTDAYAFGTVAYALGADMDTKEYADAMAREKPDMIIAAAYGRKRDAAMLAKTCGCYVAYTSNGYGAVYDQNGQSLVAKENGNIFIYEISI